jgi:hypothetical protein
MVNPSIYKSFDVTPDTTPIFNVKLNMLYKKIIIILDSSVLKTNSMDLTKVSKGLSSVVHIYSPIRRITNINASNSDYFKMIIPELGCSAKNFTAPNPSDSYNINISFFNYQNYDDILKNYLSQFSNKADTSGDSYYGIVPLSKVAIKYASS